MGCDEDGREEGGTGDEEAQGTTIRGRGCRGHVYGWRQSYAGQNFQLAISGLAQMNLKSLWMSSSILMDGNEDGKISLDEYIKV